MNGWTLGTSVLFGAMLFVTAATQLRRWRWASWVKRYDACALIPTWTFFAPNPGVTDARVLWRERLVDDTLSPWHEIVPPGGGPCRAIWNPHKRARKAITDCGPMVVRLAARRPDSALPMLSLPYLTIVQHMNGLPGSPLSVARQFTVIYTDGVDTGDGLFKPAFVSHWHARPGAADLERTGPAPRELVT